MKKLILTLSVIGLLTVTGCKKETIKPKCPTVVKIEVSKNAGGITNNKITLSDGRVINKELSRLNLGDTYCGI